MRYFWMGFGLLLGLIVLSVWVWFVVDDIHMPIGQGLEAAAEAVLEGDWEQGTALVQQARSAWEQHRRLTAALSSHTAIEEMDTLFSQVELYLRLRDQSHCAAACQELADLAATAAEGQAFTWWNLL